MRPSLDAVLTGFLLSLIVATATSSAQASPLIGNISSDFTLAAASPGPIYEVVGDVTVVPGVTLTIEPGVTLIFTANSDLLAGGLYPDKCELSVFGQLVVGAAGRDSIWFRSSTGGNEEWGEIRIENGGTGSFQNASIRNATVALRADGPAMVDNSTIYHRSGASAFEVTGSLFLSCTEIWANKQAVNSSGRLTLDGCELRTNSFSESSGAIQSTGTLEMRETSIQYAGIGVLASSGTIDMSGVEILDVYRGIEAIGASGTIQGCSLRGFSYYHGPGIHIGPEVSTAPADSTEPVPTIVNFFETGVRTEGDFCTVQNLVVYRSRTGIFLAGHRCAVNYCTLMDDRWGIHMVSLEGSILNTIVTETDEAIYAPGADLVDYVGFWGNLRYDFLGNEESLGPSILHADPQFVAPGNLDFRLKESSEFKSFSNSGGEIGAFGPGPGSVVQASELTWGRVKASRR